MAKGSYATVLSVRQPWAWLLVHGYKDIENRNWSTGFRGRCLIHAGKSFDQEGYEWVRQHFRNIKMPPPSGFPCGGIVGWVEITDCVTQFRSRWFFGKYGFVIGKRGELPFAPLRGKLGLFPLEQPYLVIVEVTPDSLEVDSGDMADVRVSVRDLDGLPLVGIPLYGQTDPHEMGPVSIFEETDTDGDSTGTWTAGTMVGTGKLIVSAPDAQGEADIELYSPPDGDDDDDDDDGDGNGNGGGNGHGHGDGNDDGDNGGDDGGEGGEGGAGGTGGTGGRGGTGKGNGQGHGGRGGAGKGHGPGDGNGTGNGGSHGGRQGPGKGGKGPGQGTTGGKHGTRGKGGGGGKGGRGGLDVGDKSLGGGG